MLVLGLGSGNLWVRVRVRVVVGRARADLIDAGERGCKEAHKSSTW